MRKTLCIILVITTVLSLAAVVFAACYKEFRFPEDAEEMIVRENVDPEFVTAPCENVYFENSAFSKVSADNRITPYALTQMQFANESPLVFVVSSEDYVIKAGETVSLSPKTCVWAPEHYEIEIGFWNMDTGTTYSKTYSEGTRDKTISYPGLPAGTYKLFVVNNSPKKLTTGYMLYQVN